MYVTTYCLRAQEGGRPLGFEVWGERPRGERPPAREGDLWGIATSLWGNLWGIVGAGHGTSELILRAHLETPELILKKEFLNERKDVQNTSWDNPLLDE